MKRYSGQTREPVEDFYGKSTSDGVAPNELGQSMIEIIRRIDAEIEYEVWGLTSVFQLVLLSKDDGESPWQIRITAQEYSMYKIEYLLPDGTTPWRNAYAEYVAESVEDAILNIRIAIQFSGVYDRRQN